MGNYQGREEEWQLERQALWGGWGAEDEPGENCKWLLSQLCGDRKTRWLAFPFSFRVQKGIFQDSRLSRSPYPMGRCLCISSFHGFHILSLSFSLGLTRERKHGSLFAISLGVFPVNCLPTGWILQSCNPMTFPCGPDKVVIQSPSFHLLSHLLPPRCIEIRPILRPTSYTGKKICLIDNTLKLSVELKC